LACGAPATVIFVKNLQSLIQGEKCAVTIKAVRCSGRADNSAQERTVWMLPWRIFVGLSQWAPINPYFYKGFAVAELR
jgi:hypothetical protein